jgi:6-phosphogluconolactonase
MPYALFVCLQDDDKIAAFAIDAETGRLTPQTEVAAAGGPSVMASSPDRRTLYVGHRTRPAISSFRIDQSNGGLTLLGTVSQEHAPTFLAPDRVGKYLLCAYYQGGGAAVHSLGEDGAVGAPSLSWLATATGAHAIATDPSNRFAFVPHIARLNDNVLEPPKENPGPNMILQFRFDAQTGRLTANSPFRVEPTERLGPRHYCFHPTLDLVFFSKRARLQRHGLSSGQCDRPPLRGADGHEPTRRVHRTEHLLPDTPHGFGEIPLRGQPRA